MLNTSKVLDSQRLDYERLLDHGIREVIEEQSTVVADTYEITYKMFPIDSEAPMVQNGTVYNMIVTEVTIKNILNGSKIKFNVDLLKLPVLQELGFKIDGNYMQMLDEYDRAKGWYFLKGKPNKKGKSIISAMALGSYGKQINFVCTENNNLIVDLAKLRSNKGESNSKKKVSAGVFLRAISNLSNTELISKFGFENPYVVSVFTETEDKSYEECVNAVIDALLPSNSDIRSGNLSMKVNRINRILFSMSYFSFDSNNANRFENLQSFKNRAKDSILSETVEVNGRVYERGTILNNDLLDELDALPITELPIEKNGKRFVLRKFSTFTFRALGGKIMQDFPELGISKGKELDFSDLKVLNDSDVSEIDVKFNTVKPVHLIRRTKARTLHLDEVFTAFSMWLDNVNGLNAFDNMYELTNRVCISVSQLVSRMLARNISTITQNISEQAKVISSEESLTTLVGDFGKQINTNDFIERIKNQAAGGGQMSEMCNILAYSSKNNKVFTNVNPNNVTDEAIQVHDTQEGRLDPFDVPESNRIGSVHNKTIFAEYNDSGELVSPYLVVKNGEVQEGDPVYLTASDEAGKYVAQWNETFLNEDGSKKERVRARIDGKIVEIETNKVSYKEYSNLQSMSISHSLVSFPGHTNAKRVTMSCNEWRQALMTFNPQRPFVGTGAESIIDFGSYTTEDILQEFYESNVSINDEFKQLKDLILGSDIKLTNMNTKLGTREFEFEVMALSGLNNREGTTYNCTCTLTVPYMLRNFQESIFSYRLNHKPDGIYHSGDIVAHNTGYSVEKKEREDLIDYGAYKVDEKQFDSGAALGQNLVVAYKTYGSTTIDDSLTISNELVYECTLTHARLILKEDEAVNNDNKSERFGIKEDSNVFDFRGLPKKGTILKPGDKVISKIVSYGSEEKVRYKTLSLYESGQVINSEIINKNGKTIARVLIASRADIEVGDKMVGRHGNKGVVAKIVPAEQMPFDPETGLRVNVLLTPLGVPSRQNISQFLEAALGICRLIDGKQSYVAPYMDNDLEFVKEQMDKFDVHPRMLIDGRTGQYFKRPVNVGVLYMAPLQQTAVSGIHAIGMDAGVDPVFLQPRKGSKNDGGQSFGEMENWCLHGVGANKLLQDFYGFQSDDAGARNLLKHKISEAGGFSVNVDSINKNDSTMLAMLRSLGVTIETANDSYSLKPMTDEMITALNMVPVKTVSDLHSTLIFGRSNNIINKEIAKDKWSWLKLNTEMIHPLWLRKNNLGFAFTIKGVNRDKSLSSKVIDNILKGTMYVGFKNGIFYGYANNNDDDLYPLENAVNEYNSSDLLTGIPAIVRMYKEIDMISVLNGLEEAIRRKKGSPRFNADSGEYRKLIKRATTVRNFVNSDMEMSDFIITTFPVMPTSFRPDNDIGSVANMSADFDQHYRAILNAAKKVADTNSTAAITELYERIAEFTGVQSGDAGKKKNGKRSYKSVLNFFAGSESDDHGALRSRAQSKRIFCSGRSTITPAEYGIKPTQLGVPMTMLVVMADEVLAAFFEAKKSHKIKTNATRQWLRLFGALALKDYKKFQDIYEKKRFRFKDQYPFTTSTAFTTMREWIKDFFEGRNGCEPQVVCAGRQPSLHEYSIRAFRPVVLDTKTIQINSLDCKGYNADFDGDRMWVCMPMTTDAKNEAIEKISPKQDMLNPKNSSVMLEHSQDISLGCYVATMLKDNATDLEVGIEDAYYYDNLSTLEFDVQNGIIEPWDLVCYTIIIDDEVSNYLSTAGRILFNSLLEEYGFTDRPFSNPFNIANIDTESFNDLAYDGLITSGKGGTDKIKYINLQDICKDLYLECNSDCVELYYNIQEFGFRYSDMFSVTLGLEDLDIESNREELLKESNEKKLKIMQDFRDGLISEADRRDAVISLYTDDEIGVNGKIQDNLIQNLPRNNNLFIMMDSGARGNKTQIMHTCGSIGILERTKTESMDDSIETNYYKGLNSFDVHMASYSARIGVASSQHETRNAGYATRKIIYMTDGTKIVENDCGKTDWWYDSIWDDRIDKLSIFKPSKQWFNDNLVGREVDGKQVTQEDYAEFAKGFNSIQFSDSKSPEKITADPYLLEGYRLEGEDGSINTDTEKYFGKLIKDDGKFNSDCVITMDKHKLKKVETSAGTLECRYHLSKMCRSELMYREAKHLEHLKTFKIGNNEAIEVITDEALDWIEEQGIDRIQARVMLDCHSKHGVCAHCYGLKYSTLLLPEVNEIVGTETAQAIGEPSAQLTLNVINKGGAAGSSIASGIDVFDAYLRGGALGGKDAVTAEVSKNSGHLRVQKIDSSVSVSIMPLDRDCDMCSECIARAGAVGVHECPLECGSMKASCKCKIAKKLPQNSLIVKDGEWIDSGYPITDRPMVSDNIVSVRDSTDPRLVLRHKQMTWIKNYFDIFTSQSILINARHFELLAMIQNQYGTVVESDDPTYKEGTLVDLKDLADIPEGVTVSMQTAGMHDVIARNSGLLAALTFAEQARMVSDMTVNNVHSSFSHNTSPIGMLSIGQDMTSSAMKQIINPRVATLQTFESDTFKTEDIKLVDLGSSLGDVQLNEMDSFQGFDLGSLQESVPTDDKVPTSTPVLEPSIPDKSTEEMSLFSNEVTEVKQESTPNKEDVVASIDTSIGSNTESMNLFGNDSDSSNTDNPLDDERDFLDSDYEDEDEEDEDELEDSFEDSFEGTLEQKAETEDSQPVKDDLHDNNEVDFDEIPDVCSFEVKYYLDGVLDNKLTVVGCEDEGTVIKSKEIDGYEIQGDTEVILEYDNQEIKFLYKKKEDESGSLVAERQSYMMSDFNLSNDGDTEGLHTSVSTDAMSGFETSTMDNFR